MLNIIWIAFFVSASDFLSAGQRSMLPALPIQLPVQNNQRTAKRAMHLRIALFCRRIIMP